MTSFFAFLTSDMMPAPLWLHWAAQRHTLYPRSKHVCWWRVKLTPSVTNMSQQDEEKKKKRQERKEENYFFKQWEYFPYCCTKSYCVARGQDEKYMSGERIFPWQPAPVRALLSYAFHAKKKTKEKSCMFCCRAVRGVDIESRAGSPASCQFIYGHMQKPNAHKAS